MLYKRLDDRCTQDAPNEYLLTTKIQIPPLPPQAHLMITPRTDLLLPIARMRGRGQVNELRAENLRLLVKQAHRFLETFVDLHAGFVLFTGRIVYCQCSLAAKLVRAIQYMVLCCLTVSPKPFIALQRSGSE